MPEMPQLRPRSVRELRAWRNAVFLVFFLSGLSIATWVARLPALRDVVGLSMQEVGLVIATGAVGSVVGLVLAPPVLARLGSRWGMSGALVTVSVGVVLVGIGGSMLPSALLISLGLALCGLGNGAVDVMMNVEAASAERELGRTLMPLMHAFFSFGTAAGAFTAAAAASLSTNLLPHFVLIAMLIGGGGVIAVRSVPIPARAAPGGPDQLEARVTDDTLAREKVIRRLTVTRTLSQWRARLRKSLAVWADIRLLLIGIIMLGMAFAEGSANDWLVIAVVDGHHLTSTEAAVMFGIFSVAMTGARVLGGPLIDRFGRVPVLRTLGVAGMVGLALFIWGSAPWVYAVGAVLWAIGCSLGFPVGMSAAADDPVNPTARVSAVAIIGYCAFLAGPPLLGFLGQRWGILTALTVVLALIATATLLAPAARERLRLQPVTPSEK